METKARFSALSTATDLELAGEETDALLTLCKEGASWIRDLREALADAKEAMDDFDYPTDHLERLLDEPE